MLEEYTYTCADKTRQSEIEEMRKFMGLLSYWSISDEAMGLMRLMGLWTKGAKDA